MRLYEIEDDIKIAIRHAQWDGYIARIDAVANNPKAFSKIFGKKFSTVAKEREWAIENKASGISIRNVHAGYARPRKTRLIKSSIVFDESQKTGWIDTNKKIFYYAEASHHHADILYEILKDYEDYDDNDDYDELAPQVYADNFVHVDIYFDSARDRGELNLAARKYAITKLKRHIIKYFNKGNVIYIDIATPPYIIDDGDIDIEESNSYQFIWPEDRNKLREFLNG